jgi:hypothetical protein
MKFFRVNPFQYKKTTHRLFSSSFLHSNVFYRNEFNINRTLLQPLKPPAPNNNHFNCPQPRYSSGSSFQRYSKSIVLCVYRENIGSSPISFHFDFPLLLNAGGLNERKRPVIYVPLVVVNGSRYTSSQTNPSLYSGLIVCRLKPRRYTAAKRQLTF